MVVVKDISRFARNTVDFLQSIRALKALGIETTFLTANMTVLGNSEFVLTIFGALAQEESANTSKRVKFGKKMNAEKGRVPNIVYGYDKTIGDYFNLEINKEEARNVRQIYKWYIDEGYGAAKIANMLNEQGIKTKRNCAWSQNAICRILTNELYTGKIINGKEEVEDFLTGVRTTKEESEWLITDKPELRIIEPEIFDKAQEVLKSRHKAFKLNKERQSNKYIFSTLIKCKECGWSFRRTVRTYKNTYIRWVCSGHNGKGVDNCPNAVTIDEAELIQALDEYFKEILKDLKDQKKTVFISSHILSELAEVCTDIGIIDEGKVVLEAPIDDILNQINVSRQLVISVSGDQTTALKILRSHPCVETITIRQEDMVVGFTGSRQDEIMLLQQLVDAEVMVYGFARERGSLESVFMQITGHEEERMVLLHEDESGI